MTDPTRHDPNLLASLFGGWSNFTQGSAGAIIGVLGAYLIAVHTSRRELGRDRARAREEAGVEAAGRLIRALADLPGRIDAVGQLEMTSATGIDSKYLSAWEKRRRLVEDEVAEHGSLLPEPLERQLTGLIDVLGNVMFADFDEEGSPVFIDAGNEDDLNLAVRQTRDALANLQAYRRSPSTVRAKSQ